MAKNLPNYGRQGSPTPLHYGDYVTHPAASSAPGSRLYQTFRPHQQGAFGMATLEHLTFSESEKLIRALALSPDTRLTVTFDGEEPEL